MKIKLLPSVLLLAAAVVSSCSDDELRKDPPVQAGNEIKFGATLEQDQMSRTHYGDEMNDPAAVKWPIYWNYPDNLDEIFIYSPQGATGRNQAKYTVHPTEPNQSTAASVTKIGEFGVQTGTDMEQPYDFYGLYPASATKGTAENHIISGTLPEFQSVTFAGTVDKPATILPDLSEVTAGTTEYLTKPDMSACLMTAENTNVTLTADDQSVSLNFKPFASVLDITVNGPHITNTKPDYRVTSIKVIADAPIVGDFSYDFTKSTLAEAFKAGANSSDTLEITTLGYDKNGNMLGMPLANQNTLRVQAFILPNPEVNNITVQVFTSDFRVWTKKLTMTSSGGESIFKPSQIHKVTLPQLLADESKFNYNDWISQLDPRIYLSELSLPGSTSSFSWKEDASNPMQHLTAKEQLAAGIRVFRCHIWLYDMASIVDGGSPSFGINVNGTTYVRPLAEVIRELATEMHENHPDEFCVLMVSDYKQTIEQASGTPGTSNYIPASPSQASYNTDNFKTFYERFKVIMNRMVERGWVPTQIDANTTIGDVKGKVIVKLQLNASGAYDGGYRGNVLDSYSNIEYLGGGENASQLNNILNQISDWSGCDGAPALMNWWTARNGSALFYSPMTFGHVGKFTYTKFDDGSSSRPVVTPTGQGIAVEAANYLVANANYVDRLVFSDYWQGSCNITSAPANIDDQNTMWYICGAQANPSKNSEWNFSQSLVTQATNAIINHYDYQNKNVHNKFFMVYLGGNGSGHDANSVTTTLVPLWNTNVDSDTYGTQRPYGWVLFNEIPGMDESVATGSAAEMVRNGIEKVISRNSEGEGFLLKRKLDGSSSQNAPNSDASAANGGVVFAPRR